MNWGYAGQLVTVLLISWALSDAFFGWLARRREEKQEAQRKLARMVDEFMGQYGERSEDPEDQVTYRRGA